MGRSYMVTVTSFRCKLGVHDWHRTTVYDAQNRPRPFNHYKCSRCDKIVKGVGVR